MSDGAGRALWRATKTMKPIGKIHLVRTGALPARLIVFISGDGGWNDDAEDVAEVLTGADALVAGVDVDDLRKGVTETAGCANLAVTLSALAASLSGELRDRSTRPVLAGHSSGATAAYVALAQAPSGRFAGALSLGFAPVLEWPTLPCASRRLGVQPKGGGEYTLAPRSALDAPWWVLQGDSDDVTPANEAEPYVEQVRSARYVSIGSLGHTFAGSGAWVENALQAIDAIVPRTRPRASRGGS
jgi:type IV secretory pathway VirJ component